MTNEMKVGGSSVADVLVVGGGPAGLEAAIAARQKGFKVTLADGGTPPIDKPCGEGMMPDAHATLRKRRRYAGPFDTKALIFPRWLLPEGAWAKLIWSAVKAAARSLPSHQKAAARHVKGRNGQHPA